jgi:acetoin utilization deacetylase AcuC-like enzyme/GNAT superfamily N-acetyltransferase
MTKNVGGATREHSFAGKGKMFRIRRVYDDTFPVDKDAIVRVQQILREQFPSLHEEKITELPEQLRNPLKYRFRSILFIAEGERGRVKGFAILQHAPDLNFCYLDFMAAGRRQTGGGIGGALYERVREEAHALKALGLFLECLTDDPALCSDPKILRQNIARLRFYERYGAKPIVNTAYEQPMRPDDDCPPYLVYDNLGKDKPLQRNKMKRIVQAILRRKYGDLCAPEYINTVVASFKDDPVSLRKARYAKEEAPVEVRPVRSAEKSIALVLNDKHTIHHVHNRGYVESPVRIRAILRELEPTGIFEKMKVLHFSENYIKAVHDGQFVEYLKRMCSRLEPGKSVYPYVFPIRNVARPPKILPIRAGYYCIDTFTPLNENAYLAAKRSVDCALTAAKKMFEGYRLAYALVRAPGHHAEHRAFGGFCYFNSAAIAAQYLSSYGNVAILDLDYHHGNGAQNIFYRRADVLTTSIHGHPRFAYPYFSGFADEKGEGAGFGYNMNVPLPEQVSGEVYREALKKVLKRIENYRARFLVVPLGYDPAKDDPTGSWSLRPNDFRRNGEMVGSLRLPTIVVQEGGYRVRSLGVNARNFFSGLWSGFHLRRPATVSSRQRTKRS